jgi:biopolymer transport protein ExbB
MWEIEAFAEVREFIETGGDVLLLIAGVTFVMWSLIIERFWYFRAGHRREARRIRGIWEARADHASWNAHQVRRLLVAEMREKLNAGLGLIKTLVALCPMLGLLGTVTGMIEVFDVMAIAGSGNTRGMASGVSKATLPTMAGMVAALSGMLFAIQLERFADSEAERTADHLELVHE